MKRQPVCNFVLAGLSLTDFGFEVPSPFCSLELSNSEQTGMTQWTLRCIVGGDAKRKVNISAFEALLYSAAQKSYEYNNASGIPVSFLFGWLNERGEVSDYLSYQGFTLQFEVGTSGQFLTYSVKGYATLALPTSTPVLRIPALSGIVQPSAVVEGLAISTRATDYFLLDIDHNDAPTYISHNAMTTSFNKYVRGTYSATDDYDTFPGLLKLSKSYSGSRDAAGLQRGYRKLSHIMNNISVTPLEKYLQKSNVDTAPQCASFSYWVDEPTMTAPGIIHYKSNANLMTSRAQDALEYGTANTNVISISGSYNGISYNMTDMNFKSLGFSLDGSGNSILDTAEVVNSWSSSLSNVFQSASIVNDLNALASQFSGTFQIQIPGTTKTYHVAQPVSLLVMGGNTLSPISGIYNIVAVTHTVSNTFVTNLRVQRLVTSSANEVAAAQGIYVSGSNYLTSSMQKTSNVISSSKVDFGILYPDFSHMVGSMRL